MACFKLLPKCKLDVSRNQTGIHGTNFLGAKDFKQKKTFLVASPINFSGTSFQTFYRLPELKFSFKKRSEAKKKGKK